MEWTTIRRDHLLSTVVITERKSDLGMLFKEAIESWDFNSHPWDTVCGSRIWSQTSHILLVSTMLLWLFSSHQYRKVGWRVRQYVMRYCITHRRLYSIRASEDFNSEHFECKLPVSNCNERCLGSSLCMGRLFECCYFVWCRFEV